MNERRISQGVPAAGTAAARDAAIWIPCPTCWGQRRILEPDRAPGAPRAGLVARPCPGCLGVGEVIGGEPPPAAEPAEEPATEAEMAVLPPGELLLPAGWTVPRRTRVAIRAAAAVGCALAAGAVAAFVAPLIAAAAIGAVIGLFCHVSMGERAYA